MSVRRSLRRHAAISLLLLALPLTGCYGQFALTRKVHAWNGRATNDRFLNSVLTWAMVIVPVYVAVGVVDFLVFNTIEFWTGENPVAFDASGSLQLDRDGHRYVYRVEADGRTLVMQDGLPAFRYERRGDQVVVSSLDGRTLKVLGVPPEPTMAR